MWLKHGYSKYCRGRFEGLMHLLVDNSLYSESDIVLNTVHAWILELQVQVQVQIILTGDLHNTVGWY